MDVVQVETPGARSRIARLRSEPYRLFFPLGVVLAAAGVGHWLLYVLGVQSTYTGKGHALAQVQGFLMAFASGFLLTMIPRRTQTPPPRTALIAVLALLLGTTTYAALRGQWLLSELAFMLVLALLTGSVVLRLLSGTRSRRPPDTFVFIPVAFVGAFAGAVLLVLDTLGLAPGSAETIGRGLVQEGMFLCLVLGIGSVVAPLLFGHPLPPDASASPESRRARALHVLAGLTIMASFVLQHAAVDAWGQLPGRRVGYGLRFLVVALELHRVGAWKRPITPGLQRRLLWLTFFLAPLGLLLAALLPGHRVAAAHVLFIGGFGLMALAVGCHVILGHGGHGELVVGSPWPVRVFAGLVLLAMLARIGADFTSGGYWVHLGIAAGAWLVALVVWAAFLVPKAWGLDERG